MARPSKLTLEKRLEDEGVVKAANNLMDDEKAVILQIKILLIGGNFRRVFKVSRVDRYYFEYSVESGRIDLLVFHSDGGVSVIEAKAANGLVSIAAGIGQLFLYSASLLKKLNKGAEPKYINKILCAPLEAEKSLEIMAACEMAGIRFVHLAPFMVIKKLIDEIPR
ncbi:MAG: hypothetical protein ACYC4K_08680 [Thiobacillus sp.]